MAQRHPSFGRGHLPLPGLRAWALACALCAIAAPGSRAHPEGEPPEEVPGAAETSRHDPCVDGLAGIFPCRNIDLLGRLALEDLGAGFGNDLWGWADPLTGREYAILGFSNETVFVDLTDPEHPVHVGSLPDEPPGSFWSDTRVWADHAYIVSEAEGFGLAIFDLRQLRAVEDPPADFGRTASYHGFGSAHNIAINQETGFAYVVGSDTCAGGLHILDLADPVAPVQVGCYAADLYTHDAQCVIYRGPDLEHTGREICFDANSVASPGLPGSGTNTLAIVDVVDKSAPVTLSNTAYPGALYTHQGWLSEDHAWFLMGDEADELEAGHGSRTYVWDVSDLDAPILTGFHTADNTATDHNLHIVGDHVYQANYHSGLRVLRMGDLASAELAEVAFFDTYPQDDHVGTGAGAWGVYPFFPSGHIVVLDIAFGAFVLEPRLDRAPECDDGIDNDGDGLRDAAEDPGCPVGFGPTESPACDDGIDNDADGLVDFDDPTCSPGAPWREEPACGIGFELVLLLPVLLGSWRRSRWSL